MVIRNLKVAATLRHSLLLGSIQQYFLQMKDKKQINNVDLSNYSNNLAKYKNLVIFS